MNQLKIPNYNSLPEYFYHWVKEKPKAPFLKQPFGNQWKILSYEEVYFEASKMVGALRNMGLVKGDHIAIYSKNCYHWIIADLAIMMGGFVSIPLYYNLSMEQLEQVLELSDAKAIFVGKLEQWWFPEEGILHDITIIRFPDYNGNAKITQGFAWDELEANSAPCKENYIPDPEELWTVLFTSGTTGTPKGVMHKHKTPVNIIKDDHKNDWIGSGRLKNHVFFSYLPLNHVAEKIGIFTTALLHGGTISFAESINTFIKNLQETQPSLFFAVPRIWTKFYLGVLEKLPLKKQRILFRVPILSNILKKKIRRGLGLANAQVIGTGSAITPAHIKSWYKQLGVHLTEAYGMTEVCGSIVNAPMHNAPVDSVGKPVPGCEIKIDPQTKEVLMKSPYMMIGYYNDKILTSKVLNNGWLNSGDKGFIDDQGFLKIIGRVSDAFKTSKGKYIMPNPLEEHIENNELIEQVCVTGLGIPQPIAIVNLSEMAKERSQKEVEYSLDNTLISLNKGLANYQRVSTIIIDNKIWNTENAILTPTLKIRRSEIDNQLGHHFIGWHEDKNKIIWL